MTESPKKKKTEPHFTVLSPIPTVFDYLSPVFSPDHEPERFGALQASRP